MNTSDLHSYVDRGDLLLTLREATGLADVELDDGLEVERATKGIEGFLSLVLRVRVPYRRGDGTRHSAVFAVKCMPREGLQLEMVRSTGAFPREGTFFHKVFPLLLRASGGKVDLPMPVCYLTKYGGDDDTIYMEDLGARGFKTPDPVYRIKGLDLDHCHLAMAAYGRLHALTIVAERLLPGEETTWMEAFTDLSTDSLFFSPGPGKPPVPFKGMVDKSIETFLEISEGLDGLPKEAVASGKLKGVLEGIWKMMKRLVLPKENRPKVLTHGDCWMNNSMYRYEKVGEESKPVEIKLIDYQIVRYCHPCIDISYFLYVNVRKPIRQKHTDSLIDIYYDNLVTSLRAMNYSSLPITRKEFIDDFHELYKGFGLICEALFIPIMLLGEDFAPANAEEFTSERYNEFVTTGSSTSVRSHYANDPHYRSMVDELYRDFVDSVFPNGLDSPVSHLFSC